VAVDTAEALPYQKAPKPRLIQNAIGVSPSFNSTMGFGQLAFSDVLGNEQWVLTIANDSSGFGDFWGGWRAGSPTFNQHNGSTTASAAFRLTSLYDPTRVLRREVRVGFVGLASYPINRFDRIDASSRCGMRRTTCCAAAADPTVDLVSNYLSLVRDNSRWSWDGPLGGYRIEPDRGASRAT